MNIIIESDSPIGLLSCPKVVDIIPATQATIAQITATFILEKTLQNKMLREYC